ncbi:MAG: Resolvase protein [Sphingomonadales bacterium]|nr:Resolvase protein [Sphingomonadales bacterium]
MRAGIYVRISRDVAGEGLGVARQEEDCRDLAKRLEWEVVGEAYIDNDTSATSGKARPAYTRLLADLDAGKIQAIIAWHPDRLYRRAIDLGGLVDACKRNDARVATVNAGEVDLTSPTGLLVADMLAAIAMYEVRHKSERWTRSWRQGRELGAPVTNSSRLFGYERDGSTVIEHEAIITRELAARFLAGDSFANIMRDLDAREIRTTQGNVWTHQGIKQYMTNPRIAGYSTLNGEIMGEGQWEPLLDRDTWESVRSLLKSRTRAHVPRKFLLNGILFCGLCKTRMITGGRSGAGMYRCPKRPDMPGCGKVTGTSRHLEEMVEAYARASLDDPAIRQRIAQLRAEPSGAQNELSTLDLRIAELEQQLDEPGVPVTTILRAIDRAKDRQAELMDKIAAVPRVPLPVQGGPWPDDLRRRRMLVDLVVKRVEIGPRLPGPTAVFNPERVTITPR